MLKLEQNPKPCLTIERVLDGKRACLSIGTAIDGRRATGILNFLKFYFQFLALHVMCYPVLAENYSIYFFDRNKLIYPT